MQSIAEPLAQKRLRDKFSSLWNMVGNTPMVEIVYSYAGQVRSIFAKCENYNLTGSIKDRMALYILQRAYDENKIKEGDTIVEATSGNTGISFASIGKKLGHNVRIIMPDWLSRERVNIIKSLGADVIEISREQGGFLGSIALSVELAHKNENIFLPRQFTNQYNVEAHVRSTGREILEQLRRKDISPHGFVAGVGTGGTIMGVSTFLKSVNKHIKVHPLEPAESPTLSTGRKNGSHRIQGISDEFIPDIVKLHELDGIVQVNDGDAILAAQKLASELGLAVGISSGANFLGAVKLQNQFGTRFNVVTVFSDSNKKYLSTDLMKEEPVRAKYLTPEIQLLEYKSISRSNTMVL